ncbi:MAG: hypothetical protein WC792_03760 [Candidatus Micrarchaeia archaeon]|jgi:hypothetical protein
MAHHSNGVKKVSVHQAYHLAPKVPGIERGKLHVLGLGHGDKGHPIPEESLPFVSDLLETRKKVVVFGKLRELLPKKLSARTIGEPKALRDFGADARYVMLEKGTGELMAMGTHAHWPPKYEVTETKSVSHSPLSAQQQKILLSATAASFGHTKPHLEGVLITKLPAALAAAELLNQTNHGKETGALVARSLQATQAHYFLQNPKAAANFLHSMENQIRKIKESEYAKTEIEQVLEHVRGAKEIFKKQAKLAG